MEVGTKESGGILKLNSADGTNAIYIDASQNVGIGTATPGVPLRVQGNACFTGTITVNCLSGGGSSLWLSDTDLIYTTGNCVGIGTDAASADLHLMKNQNAVTDVLVQNTTAGAAATATVQLSADAGSVKLEALSSSFTTSNAAIADGVLLEAASTSSGGLHLSAASTNELALWTNDTRRMTITSAGCVGIGTATTSDERFKVQGSACVTGTMYAQTFSGGGVSDDVWTMVGQDAYYKELAAGDNIGIGTTTPAHTLHVGANAASAPALLVCDSGGARIEVNSGAVKINNEYTMPAADGSAGEVICTDGSDTLTFGPGGYWTCISGPELYYNSGNVGIGTDDPGARLDVQGGGVIFNETGGDYDVRMEGDGEANLFVLDASVDRIGIGTATPSHLLDVEGVANFATCIVTPDVCATTKVVGALVCSADDICAGRCLASITGVRSDNWISAGGNICSTGTMCSTGNICGKSGLIVEGDVSFDGGTFIFNETGADLDFRIEGDAEANLFIADADVDRIGIGTATPEYLLDVEGVANFATCIVTVDVCATQDIKAVRCVYAAQRIVTISDVCALQCVKAGACIEAPYTCGSTSVSSPLVCAGTCVATPTLCASTTVTAAAGTVAGTPSGDNDIAIKCYVDTQVAAAGETSYNDQPILCNNTTSGDPGNNAYAATGRCGKVFIMNTSYTVAGEMSTESCYSWCVGRVTTRYCVLCNGCCVGNCRTDQNLSCMHSVIQLLTLC